MKIIKQGIVYRATEGPCRYQAWPSLCIDENGTLYAVWSGHRSSHVCPFGKNLMSTSIDGGETWSCPIIVNDTWLDDRDGGVTYLGEGKMLMSYFHHPKDIYRTDWRSWVLDGPDGGDPMFRSMLSAYLDAYVHFSPEKDQAGSFVKRSSNYGRTWSEPIKIPVSAPHGAVKTVNGRLLYLGKDFPGAMSRYKKMDKCDDPIPEEDRGQIFLYESFDDGERWEKVSKLPLPEGLTPDNIHEPHIVELPDGELVASLRAQQSPLVYRNFSMYFLNSTDSGKSWTEPRSCEISGSPPHLLLAEDKKTIIVSYGRREEPFGIRAVVSTDGCRSFGEELVLSETWIGDLGYPATVQLADGSFVTVYYHRYENDERTSILYTKWEL